MATIRYPGRYEGPESAPGRCFRLLEASSLGGGIILDLGCGRAPLADLVRGLEHDYVGVDVDSAALAEVRGRGHETHQLDLSGSESALHESLEEVVAGRGLAAVLAIDALEHLLHPDALLRAVRGLVPADAGTPMIVSVPNVTHLDVASKLLLGRWDLTEWGLLDDTHRRFYSEPALRALFAGSGWSEDEAADVISPESDQLFPIDVPLLRPGTPARDLLRRLRRLPEPHGATYQFVRRFLPAGISEPDGHRWTVERPADEERPFASVLLRASDPAHLQRLLADLAAQTVTDFETIALAGSAADLSVDLGSARAVEAPEGEAGWNRGIAAAEGRYLCFLDESVRVGPDWIESFQEHPDWMDGRVVRANAVSVPISKLGEESAERLLGSGRPLPVNPLDLLEYQRPGPAVLAAYAVPAEVTRATKIHFEPALGPAAAAVFVNRAAELCGVAPVSGAAVAVAGHGIDGETDLDSVADALDSEPLILPPGSARRIVDMRRALNDAHESLGWRLAKPLRGLRRLRDREQD